MLILLSAVALAVSPVHLRRPTDDLPVPADALVRNGSVVAAWSSGGAWWVGPEGRLGAAVAAGPDEVVVHAAAAPDGRLAVVLGVLQGDEPIGQRVVVTDGATQSAVAAPEPTSVAFSADGAWLAIGAENDVRLVDRVGGVRAVELEMSSLDDPLYRGLFAPMGRALGEALGLDEAEIEEIVDERILLGALFVRFLPDGRLFTSDAFAHHLVDPASGLEIARFGGGFADDVGVDGSGVLWVFCGPDVPERWGPDLTRLEPPPFDRFNSYWGGDVEGDRLVSDAYAVDPSTGEMGLVGATDVTLVHDAVIAGDEVWVATGASIERWTAPPPGTWSPIALDLRGTEAPYGWYGGIVGAVGWSGDTVVAGLTGGEVRAWQVDGTPAWSRAIGCPEPDCEVLALSADADEVRIITDAGLVASVGPRRVRSRPAPWLGVAAADGNGFVGADEERVGRIWGRRVRGPRTSDAVRAIAARGERLAWVEGGVLRLDGRAVADFGDDVWVEGLQWSPGGDALAVWYRGAVLLLDASGAERARLAVDRPEDVLWLDERRVLVASLAVTLWDLSGEAPAAVLEWAPITGYGVDALAPSPDGRRIAVLQRWEDTDRLWLLTLP